MATEEGEDGLRDTRVLGHETRIQSNEAMEVHTSKPNF